MNNPIYPPTRTFPPAWTRSSAIALALAAALLAPILSARAQSSGVWTGGGGDGLWTGDTANWLGGVVASGSGETADFSQVKLAANTSVHLDASVTIGNLIFGNTNATPTKNWTLDADGSPAHILTLAGGTPTITVTNMGTGIVIITNVLAGVSGLVKDGPGVLELDNADTFTNGTTIKSGTLILGFNSTAGETNRTDVYTLGAAWGGPATLLVNLTGYNLYNPISLATNAIGPLSLGNFGAQKADFFGAISLNGNNLIFTNGADNTSNSKFLVSDTLSGLGNVTCLNNSPAGNMTIGILNNTGTVTLAGSSGNATGFTLTFGASVTAITYVGPATVGTFTAPANPTGLSITSTSPVNLGSIALAAGLSNLTLNANSSGTITIGTVPAAVKGYVENSGSGSGPACITGSIASTAALAAVIENSATSPLILSGADSYPAPTLVSNGTLLVNGPGSTTAAGSAVTVSSGGLLGGVGTLGNLVTIEAGGTLAPGTNDGYTLGTLVLTNNSTTFKGGLALSGNLIFKVHKGLAQSNDLVSVVGSADTLTNLGTGTLLVTNVGPAIQPGDTFYLFNQALIGGGSLTISSPGYSFTNNLAVNGSITALTGGLPPAPVLTSLSPATGYTNGGTVVTLTGSNFVSGDSVTFGTSAGTAVSVNSATNITVTTPPEAAGVVNVSVTDASSQSSTLGAAFTFTVPPAGPAIIITNVPAFGTFGPTRFLSGYVTNANTATNCVMVCDYWPNENPSPGYDAKLSPWGWFSRPTFAGRLTPLQPNGNWSCSMPSNFDQYATEYAVMLVPTNFSQPAVNAAAGLPLTDINLAEAITYTDRVNTNRRAITWSGYGWWVKTAGFDGNEFLGATGPGPNYYSDSTNNVWVDAEGLLHLKITHTNSVWECVQIWNDQTLGYGQYSCTLNADISNLDANVIFSMFTWSDDTDYVDREIDMEVSRWDYAFGSNDVEDYAISPYDSGQTLRMSLPPGVTNSTHTFTWDSTNSVQFETYNGNYSASPAATNIVENWTCTAQPIPPEGGEAASLILWLYHGNAPLSGQPVEVTLSGFEFTPYGSSPAGQDITNEPQTGTPTGMANSGADGATVSFAGTSGDNYVVQRSTNLLSGWIDVWATNAPAGGVFNYTDTFNDLGGVVPASAYYRLRW